MREKKIGGCCIVMFRTDCGVPPWFLQMRKIVLRVYILKKKKKLSLSRAFGSDFLIYRDVFCFHTNFQIPSYTLYFVTRYIIVI